MIEGRVVRPTDTLLGIPVVAEREGTALGDVDAVLVDRQDRRLAGVLLLQGAHESLVVPLEGLSEGTDPASALPVLIAADAGPLSGYPRLRSVWEQPVAEPGTPVMTASGRVIGTLAAWVVDMEDGSIVTLDVLMADGERRVTMPRGSLLRIGQELTLVADAAGPEATRADSGGSARAAGNNS